jgi:hypothetical protein
MKKSKFTEAQIVFALRQAERGGMAKLQILVNNLKKAPPPRFRNKVY